MPRKTNAFGIGGSEPFDNIFGQTSRKSTSKRRPIDKPTRDAVWIKYNKNKATAKCFCCKVRPIHITDFQVGHVRAVAHGGNDNIANLRPICAPCNRGMGTMSITEYARKYYATDSKPIKRKIKQSSKKSQAEAGVFGVMPDFLKPEKSPYNYDKPSWPSGPSF